MPGGKPRKSVGQHKQDGTFRPDRHENRNEPVPEGKPKMPPNLDEVEREIWDLVDMRWCGEVDQDQLILLARTWKYLVLAMEDMNHDPRDKEVLSRFLRLSNQFNKLATDFGMSPKARTNIKLPHVPDEADEEVKRFFGVAS